MKAWTFRQESLEIPLFISQHLGAEAEHGLSCSTSVPRLSTIPPALPWDNPRVSLTLTKRELLTLVLCNSPLLLKMGCELQNLSLLLLAKMLQGWRKANSLNRRPAICFTLHLIAAFDFSCMNSEFHGQVLVSWGLWWSYWYAWTLRILRPQLKISSVQFVRSRHENTEIEKC